MLKHLIVALAIVLASMPVMAQSASEITLTASEDIADAMASSSRLDVMTARILECSRQKDAQACACEFPDDLRALKAAYDLTLAKHPDWTDASVSFSTPSGNDAPQTTVMFNTLKEQFRTCGIAP